MQSQWNDAEAAALGDDLVQLRVYTTRLLGRDPSLVLHGGGNTSVKVQVTNFFSEPLDVLYVKGSGADMATIELKGFSPVRMDVLHKLAAFDTLSDLDMVRQQRAAMLDPDAPAPSVEAILHAIIPFRYVDHTHADAVIALTNTPDGDARIREVYGDRVLVIPYVMPGFDLARMVYRMTRDVDWSAYEAMILMNHGVFTFADDARTSYERMIATVTQAEQYLAAHNVQANVCTADAPPAELLRLAELRREVSNAARRPMIARLDDSPAACGFASRADAAALATRGPLTPDHVIRTKRIAMVLDDDIHASLDAFLDEYENYFRRHAQPDMTMLDPAPRWALWPGRGIVAFGETADRAAIAGDILEHTLQTIQWADALGGWQALPEQDIFAVEYWSLEQAKLKKGGTPPEYEGKVVLVTGAASGIGLAVAQAFRKAGAAVVAADINPEVETLFTGKSARGVTADLTHPDGIAMAVETAVRAFGGLDILISNAGIFPPSVRLEVMDPTVWARSLEINLTSHQRMIQACIPYLKQGYEPSILVVGSKNFPAPGPGVGAYSVAKAGVTQLARVAALELAQYGIRVNSIHPDAVFDTGIWTPEILTKRAENYGMSVEEYKRKNLLRVSITSHDVARLILAICGQPFARTTGAQVPIDGGNDRVI